MAKLTTKFIENVKPGAARREIPDGGCRGLYLIVQPTGRKAWAVRYRFRYETRKLTLDSGLTLAEARKQATAALHELERGHDPAALKFDRQAQAKQTADERARDTVDNLAHQFVEQYSKRKCRPSTWRQHEHVFQHDVLPAWSGRTVHDITRRDVIDLVEHVAKERPVMANRALAVLSKFFSWLLERDVIPASPCSGVKRPTKETPRERVLNDHELKTLWLACGAVGGPAGACIKLLVLLGQRRGEIGSLRWDEIKGATLELPASRMKGKRPHTVPLSRQAAEIIAAQPHVNDFVFGRPLAHFDRAKKALDEHMENTPPWTIHDIRRSVISGLARIGVQLPVIERLVAHRSGSFAGVVAVYQHHHYLNEQRAAVERWSSHIERVVAGKSAHVIKMR